MSVTSQWPAELPVTAVRFARPTQRLAECAEFYRETIRLTQLFEFHDHSGYCGFVFGLPDRSAQLELVERDGAASIPPPDPENAIVFYLSGTDTTDRVRARLEAHGLDFVVPENPYWVAAGAFAVADPDGWIVIFVPSETVAGEYA
jgi:catechol 2,3-dioxygenase-like lactoylglutathione lyase family enzyme